MWSGRVEGWWGGGWCGRNLFVQLPTGGGWWKNFESWSIETVDLVKFVLFFRARSLSFPFFSFLNVAGNEGRWPAAGTHPPLITPLDLGPVRGSVVTRSIFISKSFHLFPPRSARNLEEGWGGVYHGLNRMITRNRIRWTFFGANRFHRFYRVLENERRVDRIKFNPMIEKSSIFAIASPRYSVISHRGWCIDNVFILFRASKC